MFRDLHLTLPVNRMTQEKTGDSHFQGNRSRDTALVHRNNYLSWIFGVLRPSTDKPRNGLSAVKGATAVESGFQSGNHFGDGGWLRPGPVPGHQVNPTSDVFLGAPHAYVGDDNALAGMGFSFQRRVLYRY